MTDKIAEKEATVRSKDAATEAINQALAMRGLGHLQRPTIVQMRERRAQEKAGFFNQWPTTVTTPAGFLGPGQPYGYAPPQPGPQFLPQQPLAQPPTCSTPAKDRWSILWGPFEQSLLSDDAVTSKLQALRGYERWLPTDPFNGNICHRFWWKGGCSSGFSPSR